MVVRFTKNSPVALVDSITCVRPDGSSTTADMRRIAILPHEAFHWVVESTLGWHDAFFGLIARGDSLAHVTATLHRQDGEWTKNIQAQQSEALVESLSSEQWAGPSDPATFAEKLIAACRRRGVLPPDITADELDTIRRALREFGALWRPLLPGHSIERSF